MASWKYPLGTGDHSNCSPGNYARTSLSTGLPVTRQILLMLSGLTRAHNDDACRIAFSICADIHWLRVFY